MSSESSKTTDSSQQTSPWAPQAGALTNAFANAQNAYNTSSQAQAPTNFTAQFTPDQLATFRSMLNYANGNQTPAGQASAGAALTNAGVNGATGALMGLSNFNPGASNKPQALVDAANQYVAGQDINGQVANSMLPALQQARDVTLPGIEQNAAINGNTNSSRTGIADGLVQRGLAEQSANLGATLRNSAFTNGLQLASNNANSNNQLNLGALSDALSGGTNVANSGVNAGTSSINDQGALYGMAENAGQGQQSADQANLTNQYQNYNSLVSSPYASLQQLMSIIGNRSWGSQGTGTATQTTDPSQMSDIASWLGMGSKALGMFGI